MIPGALFGYQILSCLHRAGAVSVYRAQKSPSEAPVILKVVEKDLNTTETLKQFENEHRILKRLSDVPSVPNVMGFEDSNTHQALIIENIEGINLEEYRKVTAFTTQELVTLIQQCCQTLDAIHQHQVIHKDIKPSNILLEPKSKKVWLIDFGLAIRASQKLDQYYHPTSLTGSLCYMPPEQTGRVNRQIDFRSDYYSLGVTAYQLLTGKLPFSPDQSDSELIYELLAKVAIPPNTLNNNIPSALSDIVMKLMEKDAENRYQTIDGIEYDLEHCLEPSFHTLASHDIPPNFSPTHQLYGRESEQIALKNAFQTVIEGRQHCCLVAGYSGVGKTALVHELYRNINDSKAFLVEGKFDQLQRNQPLYGFTKAFEDFFGSILTLPEPQIRLWKNKVESSLGKNAGVVTQHIHNLEHLIGTQPEPLYLAGTEGFNRLIYSFQKLIQAIASREHPLVIFIDDLQWIDDASLKLLEHIHREKVTPYTFIIGAYRDNEVKQGHSLLDFINAANTARDYFSILKLDNLPLSATINIIQDGFRGRVEHPDLLGQYLHEKTAGNPFFTIQYINQLINKKIIEFKNGKQWVFDRDQIQQQTMAENVLELMKEKIQSYPDVLSELLFIAAAIGHQFTADALKAISNRDIDEINDLLLPAIKSGLIQYSNSSYHFCHDGIQKAAIESNLNFDQSQLHLKIAQYLLAQYKDVQAELNKHVFDICFHVNKSPKDAKDLPVGRVSLNLHAAQQARLSSAYRSANDYISTSIHELEHSHFTQDNQLKFSVYKEAAECAFLINDAKLGFQYIDKAYSYSKDNHEKCQLLNLRVIQLVSEGNYLDSMQVGIDALSLYDIILPGLEQTNDIEAYYQSKETSFNHQWTSNHKTISDLYNLPVNSDPEIGLIMELLGSLYASALMSFPDYLKVITITLVDLSIEYGNTPISPIAYAWHGSSIAAISDHYDDAYEFGQLAIRLNEEKINNPTIGCKLYNMVGNFISFFKEPINQTLPLLRRAYDLGIASGDKLYAGYSIINEHRNALSTGIPLQEWLKSDVEIVAKLEQCDADVMIEVRESFKSHVLRLMGNSADRHSLDNADFNESNYRKKYQEVPLFGALLDSWKIQSSYLLGDYDTALPLSCFELTPIDSFVLGAEYRFYAALTLFRLKQSNPKQFKELQADRFLSSYCNRIRILAESCPENFSHLWSILQSLESKLNDDLIKSSAQLNQAIAQAKSNRFLQYEALANELLGELFSEINAHQSANNHLKHAYDLYSIWGSYEKLSVLKEDYPEVDFENVLASNALISSDYIDQKSILQKLDINSLIQASLALSSEIQIDQLIDKLMTVATENAGAQKCVLLTKKDENWEVSAQKIGNKIETTRSNKAVTDEIVPMLVVNFVSRSNENLILGDASSDKVYGNDPYILNNQIKSVMCIPLVHQNKTRAILYLENNLSKHTFNLERATRLELLSSQMASAMENATTYQRLSDREAEYRSLIKSIPVGIVVCDANAEITYVNPLAYKLLRLDRIDISGMKLNDVEGTILDENGDPVSFENNPVNIVLSKNIHIHGEIYGYQSTKDPEPKWFVTSSFPQYLNDEIENVVTCVVDITERRKNERKIQHLAYHDSLTDLPNRTALEERLDQLIQQATQDSCLAALITMDIDNFNIINDSLGHWSGDQMLIQVMQRTLNVIDKDSFFARLGGDEFSLLITSTSNQLADIQNKVNDTAQAIQNCFEAPFTLGQNHIKSTASFGASIIPNDASTVDSALRFSDIALQYAKKTGRNKLSYFDAEHEQALQRQIELAHDLRIGIEQNQLHLLYQPKVDLKTQRIVGAEALVRWLHPEKGMISPVEFIPIAEESELIINLGHWVLNEAVRQLSIWRKETCFSDFTRMSVNVSPFQFNHPDFMNNLESILSHHGVPPSALDLEVTEYLLIDNTDYVIEKLNQLRSMGITISIDDFGTGYSSLSYLKRLPIDTLKVDQSFVFDMNKNEEDKAIVQTILAMAQTLNLKTVAEGVESEEHLKLLQEYKCDQYQGYLFSKPIDPDQFKSLINQS